MTTATRPLAGVTVLVTRPAEHAESLCRMIEAAGGRAIRLPVIRVTSIPISAATQTALDRAARYHVVIFVSRNAVRYGAPLLRSLLAANAQCSVLGVGPATIDALREAGLNPMPAPPGTEESSEGLLRLDVLTAPRVTGQQMLIVRGVGGRELLADTLRQRGAEVCYAEVYGRTPNDVDIASAMTGGGRPRVAIITSVQSLERFAQLIRAQGQDRLFKSPLAVLSRRIAERAVEVGFSGATEVAAQASDAALLDAVISLARTRY
ncbi:MAG: uroporphyrinogen-III synthase [Chromatiales bacterium]